MMENIEEAEPNFILSDEIPLYLPDELLDENSFTSNEEVLLNQQLSFTNYSDQVQKIKIQLYGIREDIDENILGQTLSEYGLILHLPIKRENLFDIAFALVEIRKNANIMFNILSNYIKFYKN